MYADGDRCPLQHLYAEYEHTAASEVMAKVRESLAQGLPYTACIQVTQNMQALD